MIVVITGKPGSGKSTIAKVLAKKLGYKHISTGDLRGELATEKGMTIDELNEIGKNEDWTDKEIDNKTKEIGKTQNNLVFDSWLAWNFIPNSIKIFLDVDLEEAAKRIFANQRPDEEHKDSVKKVLEMITNRMHNTVARYKKWYNVDFLDMNNYDLVLDTTQLTPEQIISKLLDFLEGKDLKKE